MANKLLRMVTFLKSLLLIGYPTLRLRGVVILRGKLIPFHLFYQNVYS